MSKEDSFIQIEDKDQNKDSELETLNSEIAKFVASDCS